MAAIKKAVNANEPDDAARVKEGRRELGRILKTWREAQGHTQADLAELLGLKYYSFISQVENGIGRIPQSLYAPWAAAVGVEKEAFAWTVLAALEPSLYDMLRELDPDGATRTTH